jgi:hypothetical protein
MCFFEKPRVRREDGDDGDGGGQHAELYNIYYDASVNGNAYCRE